MNPLVKVGDKVRVAGWNLPVVIEKIYFEDRDGKETKWEFEASRVMLSLNWGEHGKSKVSMNDKDKVWFLYSAAN